MIIERLEEQDAHQVVTTVRQCCMSVLAFAARSGFTDRVIAVKRKTTADCYQQQALRSGWLT
jgi:hypothetical protein